MTSTDVVARIIVTTASLCNSNVEAGGALIGAFVNLCAAFPAEADQLLSLALDRLMAARDELAASGHVPRPA